MERRLKRNTISVINNFNAISNTIYIVGYIYYSIHSEECTIHVKWNKSKNGKVINERLCVRIRKMFCANLCQKIRIIFM